MGVTKTTEIDLRAIREERGAMLEDYADKLGISLSHLSRIERGLLSSLDIATALRIASLYGIEVERLSHLGREAR